MNRYFANDEGMWSISSFKANVKVRLGNITMQFNAILKIQTCGEWMHIRPAAFIAIIKYIVSRLKFVPMTENVRFDLKKDDFHLLGTHPNARLAGALETVLEE